MRTDSDRMLADRLNRVKHADILPAVEAAWHKEIHRRTVDLESGRVEGIPLEETLAKARAIANVGSRRPRGRG